VTGPVMAAVHMNSRNHSVRQLPNTQPPQ
jgi:hypothetical protein